jgi:DNA helicase-2/ATP-dependent DNA helicase PcrA
MITMDLEKDLNQEQYRAVMHIEGPLLVLAGAGSGKTRCVTYRIANLLEHGVPADTILGVTFTNKAAAEMKERVERLTHRRVLVCTFHSLGARILRASIQYLGYSGDFTIYDEDDCDKVIKACLKDLGLDDEESLEPKTFKWKISEAKNSILGPDSFEGADGDDLYEKHFGSVYRCYTHKMKEYNALDFDDLLYLTVRLFKEHPEALNHYQNRWQFLLVDEYQDTNEAQYQIVSMLVSRHRNLFVVGDPDQSIYSWRGADISNILNFEKDFPGAEVVRLEHNYRSTENILNAANALISYNYRRYEKNLWSSLGKGEKIQLYIADTDRDEARFVAERVRYHHREEDIPFSEMAILYRTNFQSRLFEDQLLNRRIPYIIIGGISFYQRKEVKDVISY